MSHPDRLTCEETFERLDDYLDRELSADEVARVNQHLETCALCTSEYRFEAKVLEDLKRKIRQIEVPASALEKVRRALESERPR